MALTKTVTVVDRKVMDDGQIEIIEETNVFEDGTFLSGRKDIRIIDVGDDASSEDDVTKDMAVAMNTVARKAVRDAVKAG